MVEFSNTIPASSEERPTEPPAGNFRTNKSAMNEPVAHRLRRVNPSMILGLVQKARQLAAAGRPVIDLGIGEPDFKTPDHVKAAGIDAIQNDVTRYTIVPGITELREAITEKLAMDNSLEYAVNEVSVSGGAKQAIFNAMMATLSPGDEVIIPAPFWSSYPDIVSLCDGVPVVVECSQEQRFLISPDQLGNAIGPRTKWLVINSPSNPTGGVYQADQLRALAEVLDRYPDVYVLSDDIYEHLMFDGNVFTSILNVAPRLRERTLLVNGVSKVFAMTGWRIGYSAGAVDLIRKINTVQGQSTTHACSISQAASVAALKGPRDFIAERANTFRSRRDLVVSRLSDAQGISTIPPEGAFYVYPNCDGVVGKKTPQGKVISSDMDFCAWLLDHHYVSTVPGAAFGLSAHFRISTAACDADLSTACDRIVQACAMLRD